MSLKHSQSLRGSRRSAIAGSSRPSEDTDHSDVTTEVASNKTTTTDYRKSRAIAIGKRHPLRVEGPKSRDRKNEKSVDSEASTDGDTRPGRSRKGSSRHFTTIEDGMKELIETANKSGENVDLARYWPLCKAVQEHNWKEVQVIIENDSDALRTLTSKITELGETIFHKMAYADHDRNAISLLESFVSQIPAEELKQTDVNGDPALSIAALLGNTKAAKIFVEKDKNLPYMKNKDELLPVHQAARFGQRETVDYLLSVIKVEDKEDFRPFAGKSGALNLLQFLIESNLYGSALDLLKLYPTLAREENYDRGYILKMLAKKPLGFKSGSSLGVWQRIIYRYIPVKEKNIVQTRRKDSSPPVSVDGDKENPVESSENPPSDSTLQPNGVDRDEENPIESSENHLPDSTVRRNDTTLLGGLGQKLHNMFWNSLMFASSIKTIHDMKLTHQQTIEIVRMMCDNKIWNLEEASETLKTPILTAAKMGIYEFVHEVMKAYFYSFIFADENGHNIFMLSVLYRQEEVFNLIYKIGALKKWVVCTFKDRSDNNILHLAGNLVPSTQVPGAAMQMQRELQWFKAVESLVNPSHLEEKNSKNRTPREVFTEAHEILVDKGERWMKDTAQSCTVAAALIITVVFAAAFTVPGGNTSAGTPNFLLEPAFVIFVISDAFALFFSITSVLMFLGILTSRYSEEDFLRSLPKRLIFGLVALFFSIACMMVAFGAVIYIVISDLWSGVLIPIALLCFLTVILFSCLQFPLVFELWKSTYGQSIFRPNK